MRSFSATPIVDAGIYKLSSNIDLYRLDFLKIGGAYYFKKLFKVLNDIKPDVVHLLDIVQPYTVQFFLHSKKLNYNVYTANSYHLSVLRVHKQWDNPFSLLKYKWLFFKVLPGKLMSKYYIRCYANAADTKFVAEKYMGVPPSKCVVAAYGVDTDVFTPVTDLKKELHLKRNWALMKMILLQFIPAGLVKVKTPYYSRRQLINCKKRVTLLLKDYLLEQATGKEKIKNCGEQL